jgi:1,4-dihydroxy-6-naphthoate synthase
MLIDIGFSPCPNDTFIFDALVNGLIDTGTISFNPVLEDVQTLNEWALQGRLDCTKISYGVYPLLKNNYHLLEAGGALGTGVGPLLIAKQLITLADLSQLRIAIPGKNTTAHLLFSMAFPEARNKIFMAFHEIEQAVIDGRVDAGVIIHENRFTYAAKGLVKLIDLGEYWESKLHCPIPLGGIVVKNSFDPTIIEQLNTFIKQSIEYSWQRYPQLSGYIKDHAQEMREEVMRQHIQLYVNDYSLALGEKGHAAIEQLCKTYALIF